jgi:hypothetical protein
MCTALPWLELVIEVGELEGKMDEEDMRRVPIANGTGAAAFASSEGEEGGMEERETSVLGRRAGGTRGVNGGDVGAVVVVVGWDLVMMPGVMRSAPPTSLVITAGGV